MILYEKYITNDIHKEQETDNYIRDIYEAGKKLSLEDI